HPDRQRGQGHLDEITCVVDGLGEGSREHDELSTVLGRLVGGLPLGVSVDFSMPSVIPPGYARAHIRRRLSGDGEFRTSKDGRLYYCISLPVAHINSVVIAPSGSSRKQNDA